MKSKTPRIGLFEGLKKREKEKERHTRTSNFLLPILELPTNLVVKQTPMCKVKKDITNVIPLDLRRRLLRFKISVEM